MNIRHYKVNTKGLMMSMIMGLGISFNALAHEGESDTDADSTIPPLPSCQILTADRFFDGNTVAQEKTAVLIEGDKIKKIGSPADLSSLCSTRINLGDATILPGFIESHAHVTFQNVRKDTVLEHGITTVQDTGGPLMMPEGGQGTLRLLSVGPIIQAANGYPLNIFGGTSGYDKIGISVGTVAEAEKVVVDLVNGGATAIKIALEPGGETGAPWMQPHDGPVPATPWPLLSQEVVNAIVTKAHALNKRVIAHVGENIGFERALIAGVDEFAHMPCSEIKEDLLQRAVKQGATFVSTIDTLSSCVNTSIQKGIHSNTMSLASKGAKIIYGSEVAHDNVPWGINGEELHMILHLTSGESVEFPEVVNVLKSATSQAGQRLGIPGLGTLTPDAPADLIAVRGNPIQKFKLLEYPDLVISGGRAVVNKFKLHPQVADAECLFTWVEKTYPQLLKSSGAYTEVSGTYNYRHYAGTNAYLGVSTSDNHVYYKGADGVLQDKGLLSTWTATAGCQ